MKEQEMSTNEETTEIYEEPAEINEEIAPTQSSTSTTDISANIQLAWSTSLETPKH